MIADLIMAFWPYVAAIGGALALLIAAYVKGGSNAKARAAVREAKREAAAKNERLEMNREATEVERRAAALSDEEARKEAMRWTRKP